jgi:hypothetical protein
MALEIPLAYGVVRAAETENFWVGMGCGFALGYLFVVALIWIMVPILVPPE